MHGRFLGIEILPSEKQVLTNDKTGNTVWQMTQGDPKSVTFRFDTTYMKMAAEGKLKAK